MAVVVQTEVNCNTLFRNKKFCHPRARAESLRQRRSKFKVTQATLLDLSIKNNYIHLNQKQLR